jgi:nitroreductase
VVSVVLSHERGVFSDGHVPIFAPGVATGGQNAGMDLLEVMTTTPATREFSDAPMPDDVLFSILDHARFAPNGGNRQAWHVIVVRDPGRKRRIAELWEVAQREDHAFYAAGLVPFVASEAYWRNPPGGRSEQPVDLESARRTPATSRGGITPGSIESAAALLVVTLDLTRVTAMDSGLGRLSISAGGSVYPFAHNVLLAARNAGYGGVITTVLVRQEPAVKELLGIPPGHALACTIPLGRPTRLITRLRRNRVEEFTTLERFDGQPFSLS